MTSSAPGGRLLKLHPGGALVSEETSEVQESRQLHEAAFEAAQEFSREEDENLCAPLQQGN